MALSRPTDCCGSNDSARIGHVGRVLAAAVFGVLCFTGCTHGGSNGAAPKPIPTVTGPPATAGCTGVGNATAPTKEQAAKTVLRAILAGNQQVACSLVQPELRIDSATEGKIRAAFPHGLTDDLTFKPNMETSEVGGIYVLRNGQPILSVSVVMTGRSDSQWWAKGVRLVDCLPPPGYWRCVNDTGR